MTESAPAEQTGTERGSAPERWRNWSGRQRATPNTVARPATGVAVRHAVADAVRMGRRIKPVGAGHSFTAIACADDILLDLRDWTGVVAHDAVRHRVTVRSGTRLWQLWPELDRLGLAMANLGDIDRQSIAGAIATGTHGTGAAYGSLSSQVVGLTVVDGHGEEFVVDESDPDLLNAYRVSLGALGVITEVTLQCVPAFDLATVEAHAPLDSVLDRWADLRQAHDHFEFYWFGHSDTVITKSIERRPRDATRWPDGRGRLASVLTTELVDNVGLGAMCQLGRFNPGLVPRLNRLATAIWSGRTVVDRSDRVFTTSRRVRFVEMEYGFAVDEVPAVLAELREMFRRDDVRVTFPLEVRVAAADEAWLSTSYGRATGYVAVHQFAREDENPYFRAVEEIFAAHGGRPHWGKQHTRTAAELAPSYPRMADFLAVRERQDPARLFANPYLEQVLG